MPGRRKYRNALSQPARRFRRHVFKIESDRVNLRGKRFQRGVIGPFGHHQRRDLPGASVRGAINHQRLYTQWRRGERKHAG